MKKSFFNLKYFWIFIFGLLILFFIIRSNTKSPPLINLIHSVTTPIASFFYKSGFWFSEKISIFSSIGELKNNNQILMKENLSLKYLLTELNEIKNENEQLRKNLAIAPRKEYDMEAAFVIGQDINSQSELIFIDKGSKNGIEKGSAVVVEKGILIGQVNQVFYNQSSVELILSQSKNINAEVQENSEKGIVHGEYNTSVVLDLVPQIVELKKGDTVITSGLSEKIPRGLLIGYINNVLPSPDNLFQKASLILPVDFNKIRLVWIIKNEKND